MASNERALTELDCSNLANDWPNWKRNFMVYMIASGKSDKEEQIKIANFIWLIGTNGANIYNTLFPNDGTQNSLLGTVTTDDAVVQLKLNEVLEKFDQHCLPQRNIAMETYKFNTILQKERQTFMEFETELRTQVRHCDFNCKCGESFENRMLRDQIIVGVFDKKLQLKLLDGRDDKLERVIDICKTYEAANINKGILDSKKSTINIVKASDQSPSVGAINRVCFNCGGQWKFGHLEECKAKDIICRSCEKKGHFQRMCRKSKKQSSESKQESGKNINNSNCGRKNVAELVWSDMRGNICNEYKYLSGLFSSKNITRLNSIESKHKRWTKEFMIGNEVVTFKLDTGADINCIPLKLIKKLKINLYNQHNDFNVFDYNNNKVEIFGTTQLKCSDLNLKKERSAEFVVVNDSCEPVLGLETCESFGLVKRLDVSGIVCMTSKETFMDRYRDVFQGLGKFPGTFSIKLKENSKPVLHYKKRIPNSLMDKLKLELDKMVQDEIISPVDYPTDWVNNLQIVEKPNGKLRICLDPKPLNECIKREHFLIPTVDDLTSGLARKRIFSVLDLCSGFWHMELEKQSSELTTFMTPFGRFKFNRVPFGLNCAPEMFQREMIKIFGDLQGVVVYFDDVAVCAESEEEHDRIMSLVMDRARINNIKFNSDKIQYRQREVKFMGNIISEGKIKADSKYKDAILKMKKPENKSDVLRFLGLLKYLARFIPNLSKQSTVLRNLTRNDVEFIWTEKHDMEFRNLLNIVISEPVLAIYDPMMPVIVQTDASKDGLGCVLVQSGHPVAFASRTLSKSEQQWAQIEKELLAIVFACQRFHFFLYGREFTVESDHKPLETLVKRSIDDVTMRLQRMFMYLLKYSHMKIIYKPGKEMLVADCLSRAQLSEISEIEGLSGIIHSVTKSVCFTEENYKFYRKTIENDKEYTRISGYVQTGWPGFHQLDDMGKHFHKLKSELHVENGLLFLNHRLVIPSEMQCKIAMWLHLPHLGIEKTLARARMLYYWPGMNTQIKELVTSCSVCEKFKRNIQKEPLVQEESLKYPFHIVAMDIFEYAGRNYIAIIDAYSGYLMAVRIQNKSSMHIVGVICQLFDKLGYPTIIRCDNSPFGSAEFERFAVECNVQFKFSSPRYPQSNGLAEKGVAIAKNILKRCYEANDVDQFQYRLLEYNTTPVMGMNITPSELFFGRLIKTKLPVLDSLLIRNKLSESEIQNKLKIKKDKQKYYYDRNARSLPVLNEGDLVIFNKNGKEWNYGKIVAAFNDRSYIIKDSFDGYFRRNRRFIAKTKNEDFNASDLLFEQNISKQNNSPDLLRESQIVIPSNSNRNENNVNTDNSVMVEISSNTNSCDIDEPVLSGKSVNPAAASTNMANVTPVEPVTTRSGRVIKAPQRYGRDYGIETVVIN